MIDLRERSTTNIEDELATLANRMTSAVGRFLELLGELDRREPWVAAGLPSLAHWLGWRCGLDLKTAREHVRVARALRDLPKTKAALDSGRLSYSKARAIARAARAENEEAFIELAQRATSDQLARTLASWNRGSVDEEKARAERIERRRRAQLYFDDDGMLVVRARLAPEEGAVFMRAMDVARDAIWTAAPKDVSVKVQRADQLAYLADRVLSASPRKHAQRAAVNVSVDQAVLADPAADGQASIEGVPVGSPGTCRRLACDATVVETTHTGSESKTGQRWQVISAALRRVLQKRDGQTCSYPGCTYRIISAHLLKHWSQGGKATSSNALLACRFHHVLLHEGGYRAEITPDGPRFFRADGRPVLAAPEWAQDGGELPNTSPTSPGPKDCTERIDWRCIRATNVAQSATAAAL